MLLYRKIDHPEDYVALQMDINSVNNWIKGNYLRFNASKCKYMLISRRRQHHCGGQKIWRIARNPREN